MDNSSIQIKTLLVSILHVNLKSTIIYCPLCIHTTRHHCQLHYKMHHKLNVTLYLSVSMMMYDIDEQSVTHVFWCRCTITSFCLFSSV